MTYYITLGEFQSQLKAYYERTGKCLQFPEMMDYLYRHNQLSENILFPNLSNYDYDLMSDAEFEDIIDGIPLPWTPVKESSITDVKENDFFSSTRDVFVIRHPRYTRVEKHKHNYFEIDFVARGSAKFFFEEEEHTLHEGELCIIAPSSSHDFSLDNDDSIVYTISIRQSTFNATFFSLLTKQDLLSYFFRTILQEEGRSNYLLFFTKNTVELKRYLRHIMIESNTFDKYSNTCLINYVYLLFSFVLRQYSQSIQFYDYQMGSDFSLVLQYIQHNYQTVTLSFLAELFHYSEPHLCTQIKQNTGYTFSELIRQLKLSQAVNYLTNTKMRISEIAENVGYNSADHFSRVFRGVYHMSPQEYRKNYQAQSQGDNAFIPYKNE